MKFIQYKKGIGVYHISQTIDCITHNLCNENWPVSHYGDTVTDSPPAGRLCSRCKKKYINKHSEEDLMLELL